MPSREFNRNSSLISSGSWESDIPVAKPKAHMNMKSDRFEKGDVVEAYWECESEWYSANIMSANNDGSYDVIWEDGESMTQGLEGAMVRRPQEEPETETETVENSPGMETESGSPGPDANPAPQLSPDNAGSGTLNKTKPGSDLLNNIDLTLSPKTTATSSPSGVLERIGSETLRAGIVSENSISFESGRSPSPPGSKPSENDVIRNNIIKLCSDYGKNYSEWQYLERKFESLEELYEDLKETFEAEQGLHQAYHKRQTTTEENRRSRAGSKKGCSSYQGMATKLSPLTPTRRYTMTLQSPKESTQLRAAALQLTKELEENQEKSTIFGEAFSRSRISSRSGTPHSSGLIPASSLDRVWGDVRPAENNIHLEEVDLTSESERYWDDIILNLCISHNHQVPTGEVNTRKQFKRLCRKIGVDHKKKRPKSSRVAAYVGNGSWRQAIHEFYEFHNSVIGKEKITLLLSDNKGDEESLFRDIDTAYGFSYIQHSDESSSGSEAVSSPRRTQRSPRRAKYQPIAVPPPCLNDDDDVWKIRFLTLFAINDVDPSHLDSILLKYRGNEAAAYQKESSIFGTPDVTNPRHRLAAFYAKYFPDKINEIKTIPSEEENDHLNRLIDTHGPEPCVVFDMMSPTCPQGLLKRLPSISSNGILLEEVEIIDVDDHLDSMFGNVLSSDMRRTATQPQHACDNLLDFEIQSPGLLSQCDIATIPRETPPKRLLDPPSRNRPTNDHQNNNTHNTDVIVILKEEEQLRRMIVRVRGSELTRLQEASYIAIDLFNEAKTVFTAQNSIAKSEDVSRCHIQREEDVLRVGRLQWFHQSLRDGYDETGRQIAVIKSGRHLQNELNNHSYLRTELTHISAAFAAGQRYREYCKKVKKSIERTHQKLDKKVASPPPLKPKKQSKLTTATTTIPTKFDIKERNEAYRVYREQTIGVNQKNLSGHLPTRSSSPIRSVSPSPRIPAGDSSPGRVITSESPRRSPSYKHSSQYDFRPCIPKRMTQHEAAATITIPKVKSPLPAGVIPGRYVLHYFIFIFSCRCFLSKPTLQC